MQTRWAIFLEKFNYVFNYKPSIHNQTVDALSRYSFLLTILHVELTGFEQFEDQSTSNPNFHDFSYKCTIHDAVGDYYI